MSQTKKRYLPHTLSFFHALKLRWVLWRVSNDPWIVHESDCERSASWIPICSCRKRKV